MFRHGEISTEVDKGPFVFTLVAFVGSTVAAVLLFVLGGGSGLAVFAGILLGIVAIGAGAVLFALVTDRAYIEDGVLTMSYLFKRARIPLSEIGRVSFGQEVYSVFDRRGVLRGTINSRLTGIGTVLHALDKQGIRTV